MKELEIQAMGKPLGRPPKQAQTKERRAEIAEAVGERNEIEATFGTGKRIYRANTGNMWRMFRPFPKFVYGGFFNG